MAAKSKTVVKNSDGRFLTKNDIEELDSNVLALVIGYIRNAKLSIPNEIAWLCLSYYYFDDDEYFANADSDYRTVSSEQEISIERLTKCADGGSAFGNVLIPSDFGGVYVWKFEICAIGWVSSMFIGISDEYKDTDEEFCNSKTAHSYCLSDDGCFMRSGKEDLPELSVYNDIYQNDVVTMTLDLHQKTLKYTCANRFENKGFDDIHCGPKINYKMAVSFDGLNDKVELIGFSVN